MTEVRHITMRSAFLKAVEDDRLPMLVVYENPADAPGKWVARMHYTLNCPTPNPIPTPHLIIADSAAELQETIAGMCLPLHWLPRFANDEPQIVGVWL